MSKLRVGIIGTGYIGTSKHLPGLAYNHDKFEIVAFCDIVEEKARAAMDEFGQDDSYVTTDYRQVLADESIDVVHVCTWNTTHREITCAALEAGKHVMCEKPMAVTGDDARAMVEAAKKSGKKLSVGFQYRFRNDVQFLKECVDDGFFGEIYAAKAFASRRRGVPTWGVFTDKEKQGGGPLIDLGGHAIDQALWLMDNYDVDYVTGVVNYKLGDKPQGNMGGEWDPAKYDVEDSAFGFVRFTNGASLQVDASWALNITDSREACTVLMGTEGGSENLQKGAEYEVVLNHIKGGKQVLTRPEAGASYFGPRGATLTGMAAMAAQEEAQWHDAIVNDHDPLVTAEQAAVVTEIMDAIYTSGRTGKPVYFGQK